MYLGYQNIFDVICFDFFYVPKFKISLFLVIFMRYQKDSSYFIKYLFTTTNSLDLRNTYFIRQYAICYLLHRSKLCIPSICAFTNLYYFFFVLTSFPVFVLGFQNYSPSRHNIHTFLKFIILSYKTEFLLFFSLLILTYTKKY